MEKRHNSANQHMEIKDQENVHATSFRLLAEQCERYCTDEEVEAGAKDCELWCKLFPQFFPTRNLTRKMVEFSMVFTKIHKGKERPHQQNS